MLKFTNGSSFKYGIIIMLVDIKLVCTREADDLLTLDKNYIYIYILQKSTDILPLCNRLDLSQFTENYININYEDDLITASI